MARVYRILGQKNPEIIKVNVEIINTKQIENKQMEEERIVLEEWQEVLILTI